MSSSSTMKPVLNYMYQDNYTVYYDVIAREFVSRKCGGGSFIPSAILVTNKIWVIVVRFLMKNI